MAGHAHQQAERHAHAPITEAMSRDWLTSLDVSASFDRPWVEQAVEWLAADGVDGAVVDVGCGAGGAACAFARRLGSGRRVVALDRDPALLAVAGRRAEAEGVSDRVDRVAGDVDRVPVPPGSVALVWASGVLHHVPDQQAGLSALVSLLRPGGRLAVVEGGLPMRCLPNDVGFGRPGLEARLDEAYARWFEDMRAELHGPPMPYGWPRALRLAGLDDVACRSFVAEAMPSLDDVGRRVARRHLESARDELGDRIDDDDHGVLARLLDPDDPESVDTRDDLVVTALRTVHTGVAGVS
jgi:ubiquinone/menaquinone biosynthesis C-methylase UbiE